MALAAPSRASHRERILSIDNRKSTIELASIENNFTTIWNPGNPSIWGFLTEQLGFVKTVFTGRLEQLDPGIAVVRDVANRIPA